MLEEIAEFESYQHYAGVEIDICHLIHAKKIRVTCWEVNSSAITSAWPVDDILFYDVIREKHWKLTKPDPPYRGALRAAVGPVPARSGKDRSDSDLGSACMNLELKLAHELQSGHLEIFGWMKSSCGTPFSIWPMDQIMFRAGRWKTWRYDKPANGKPGEFYRYRLRRKEKMALIRCF